MALKPTNTYQVSIYKEPRKLQKSKSLKIKRTINILVAEWIWSKPDLSCTKHFISNQEEKRASTQIMVGGQIRVQKCTRNWKAEYKSISILFKVHVNRLSN